MPYMDTSNKIEVPSYFPVVKSGLAFVAQSPGKKEVEDLRPLVGATGKLLRELCVTSKIDFDMCSLLNVVNYRPPGNDFTYFCGKKAQVGGKDYALSPIATGMYLRPEYLPQLDRLKAELEILQPNLVVTLGREALWALTGLSGINKYRGSVVESTLVPGLKVLPTFHPAGIFRKHGNKVYLTLDLFKARSEMGFPDIRTLDREMHIYPECAAELWQWYNRDQNKFGHDCLLSVDIEDRTFQGKKVIECIGFAFSLSSALVVPFWSELRTDHNYWLTLDEELMAWEFVEHMLAMHPVLGQNYMAYDTWVMFKEMGLKTTIFAEDTMFQHHAFQPEMQKGLGLLASIYCNVPAYKNMKPRGKRIAKRDE